jgi:ribosomal protein S18 acetylase RimI-like enzyme
MDRAERWAVEHGAERVTLSVNRANESARALYDRRGYGVRRYKMDKTVG